ncbi:MAG: cyclodeaminase/cyclohydrolase family protein [Turicibacter sp.]|nr:cyclodeaminase/cyclohydrolase family protein [Turicibacter sp.]
MELNKFVEDLAGSSPTPGGGSASALAGTLGAALVNMVAALTTGKKKYAEHNELMQEVMAEATRLKTDLNSKIAEDSKAFDGVTAVFAMPKDTDEQKEARKAAMQNALKAASLVPYEVMELGLSALKLAESILGKSNTNAASDLGVSALMLSTAVKGAWLNVRINISSINDTDFTDKYRTKGQAIFDEAEKIATSIYNQIEKEI